MNTFKQIFGKLFGVLLLAALAIPGFSQWSPSTSGTVQDLNGVHMLSATKAFITGNAGTLRITNNGGTSWAAVAVPTAQDINGIYFVNDFVGYAAVDNGGVLKTTDGGALWTLQFPGTGGNLRDVHFADVNTGYVVGENGVIFKTINGGVNWTSQASGTTERLESVFFTSAMVGYAVGRSGVYLSTVNGGTTWTSTAIAGTADLKDVFFVDANTGFISRQNNFIHKTTNGGATWQTISTNAIGNGFDAMHFVDVNTGYGVNNSGFLAKSINGGLTWVLQASGTAQNLSDVHCFNGANCMIVGDAGTVLTMVAPQGCVTPSGLITNNLTGISATLNWTVVDAATSYQIQGRAVGSAALISITIPGGATNSFNVAGLTKGTSYEWQIRSICGAGQMSDYSAFTTFTTLNCLPPAPVSTTNITASSARLNWTPVPESQGYRIFGRVVGSTQVATITVVGGATSFFDVSGLSANTSYEWSAISICNIAGAATSGLANASTFTTLNGAISKTSPSVFGQQDFTVFPNPAANQVQINWIGTEESSEATIQIVDMKGAVVRNISSTDPSQVIDLENLTNGVYHVVVSSNEFTQIKKLVVNK